MQFGDGDFADRDRLAIYREKIKLYARNVRQEFRAINNACDRPLVERFVNRIGRDLNEIYERKNKAIQYPAFSFPRSRLDLAIFAFRSLTKSVASLKHLTLKASMRSFSDLKFSAICPENEFPFRISYILISRVKDAPHKGVLL